MQACACLNISECVHAQCLLPLQRILLSRRVCVCACASLCAYVHQQMCRCVSASMRSVRACMHQEGTCAALHVHTMLLRQAPSWHQVCCGKHQTCTPSARFGQLPLVTGREEVEVDEGA